MTNIKNNSIFNKEVKDRFLEAINEGTRPSYRRIFTMTLEHELALGKDISHFDLKEIEVVLLSFKSKSRNTIESYGRIISSYLNWCVKNKIISRNVMENLRPNDFEKFIHDKSDYMSSRRLRRIEEFCTNYQDAVIIRLLFIGVNGKQMSEIRNLKREDIDFKNKRIRLINALKEDKNGFPIKYTERFISIDVGTMNLIEGAMNQKTYMKKNGEIEQTENDNIRPYTDLVNNDYVVRASVTRNDSFNAPVDKFVIYRRLSMLENLLGLERFNAKFIQQCGMLSYADDYMEGEEISLNDLKIIADRFNLKSYHNLKGLITFENIQKIRED